MSEASSRLVSPSRNPVEAIIILYECPKACAVSRLQRGTRHHVSTFPVPVDVPGDRFVRSEGSKVAASASKQASWPRALKRSVKSALPRWVLNWREAQYYLKYGEIELHFLDALCAPDRDSIDVGAHDGCYVHFLRKYSRHVYAFEPIPWMAVDLEQKFQHGVTVRPEALSRTNGTATLHIPLVDGKSVPGCSTISDHVPAVYGGASKDVTVQMRTLDGIYAGDVGFMKIDVEGHEIEVLEGGRDTIERCRPNLVIEVVERLSPNGVRIVTDFLHRRGYDGHFVHQWGLHPVEAFDARELQREEDYPDLTASLDVRERAPRFIYNFIYVPRDRAETVLPAVRTRVASLRERLVRG